MTIVAPGPAGLPILTYHAFSQQRSVTSTDPSWFSETLIALHEAGRRAIDLDDWIARGRPEEPLGFALTFDDGLASILKAIDTIEYTKTPVTLFVVAGRVGQKNDWPGNPRGVTKESLLGWQDLASLSKKGFRIAAHGFTHTRLDLCSRARIDDELKRSRETIEDKLGFNCNLHAYPYGVSNLEVRTLARSHFTGAFGTRLEYASASDDVYDIARIDAYYLKSRSSLESLTLERTGSWLRWRRMLRGVRAKTLGRLQSRAKSVAGRGSR